jgi:hypothetical protein
MHSESGWPYLLNNKRSTLYFPHTQIAGQLTVMYAIIEHICSLLTYIISKLSVKQCIMGSIGCIFCFAIILDSPFAVLQTFCQIIYSCY